jgi:hypothetical protein
MCAGPGSVEVEGGSDRLGQRELLPIELVADLLTERRDRDRRDVVAGDDTLFLQAVGRAEQNLGGEAADRGRDRRHGDGAAM